MHNNLLKKSSATPSQLLAGSATTAQMADFNL